MCSDEPRRAAAAAPRSDHGADGGSNTVRVDGISNTVRPLTPIDRRMGDVRMGSAADFSPSAWHPRQAGATGVDGAISHGEEPRPGGPRRLERHAAAGGARLPRRWSSPGKWRPRRRIRREGRSLRPPGLLQSSDFRVARGYRTAPSPTPSSSSPAPARRRSSLDVSLQLGIEGLIVY